MNKSSCSEEAGRTLSRKNFREEVENASIPSLLEKRMGRGVSRSAVERDALEGRTDTPRGATPRMMETPEFDKMVLQNPFRWRQVRTETDEKQNPTLFRGGSVSEFFFYSPYSILPIRNVLNEQVFRTYPCEIRTHVLTKFLFFNIPNEIDVMI